MKPGDWLWFQDGNSYQSVQLIEKTEAGSWLVRTFWPIPHIPTDAKVLEVRTECSEFDLPDSVVVFGNSSLPAYAERERDNFHSIRDSLNRRNFTFENGLSEVQQLMENKQFEQALELLNTVGPIQKRNPQIYLLRARCFLRLNNPKAAEYDYDFYCQLGGTEAL